MKKKIILALTAALMVLGLAGCGGDNKTADKDAGTLNLFTWAGMFPQDVLDGFEKSTGIKINYANFDTDEEMLTKIKENNAGVYDLVFADDYIIEAVVKEGLAKKLDEVDVKGRENINPFFTKQFYDKNDEYTVPYGAGIPLIVYDKNETGFELKSYKDLWDPRLEDSLALIGNYRVIDGIALKTMGESFNTPDVAKIKEAGDLLQKLAPNVRLISDANTQDSLLSKEVKAAFLYTSQVNTALNEDPSLSVCYPEEGLGYGIIASFIPSNSKNPEAAAKFLSYILEPENGAKCFEFTQYFCTFKASEPYISEDMKDRIILPEGTKLGEIVQNIPKEAEDEHIKIWNDFKLSCQ